MVPAGSPITSIADVDRKGVRIAVSARSAYDLWLENNIRNATLVRVSGLDAAYQTFMADKLDVLAGLRPGLLKDVEKAPGLKILDGKFTAVQQAVGTAKPNVAGAAFLAEFVETAKKSGLVASLIEPGSFDPERMHEQRFPGLSIFAVLPGPLAPVQALEDLLGCARQLSTDLSGMMQDEQGSDPPLTDSPQGRPKDAQRTHECAD
mgnify:CR=1 FL=1